MEIIVNGENRNVEKDISMSELLNILDIKRQGVAVELNKNILPKSEYDLSTLKDGDVIEIVQFVGGG